jgi:hypothetical protein
MKDLLLSKINDANALNRQQRRLLEQDSIIVALNKKIKKLEAQYKKLTKEFNIEKDRLEGKEL